MTQQKGSDMSNLKDGLEEFKKTFESGAAPYNATPQESTQCIVGRAQAIRN